MSNAIEDIHEFLESFAKRFDTKNLYGDVDLLKNTNISQSECLYILDFPLNQMTFKKGFKNFLGFDDDGVNLENYLNRIHPDDISLVSKIGVASIAHSAKHPNENHDNVLYISFRIQNSNGDFVKVLSQSSVFENDEAGRMTSSLVKVSDISFIEDNDIVKFHFEARNLDMSAFKREVYGDNFDLFTSREREIIREISKGLKNQEIAKILQISRHTVASHRKKIMKKSKCHSANELLHFCRRNGVL